jgi:hypothetical protein
LVPHGCSQCGEDGRNPSLLDIAKKPKRQMKSLRFDPADIAFRLLEGGLDFCHFFAY